MERERINYSFINDAIKYYSRDYKLISVPWFVPKEYTLKTINGDKRNDAFLTKYGDLVGSAEQSFVYLYEIGQLKPGNYMAITPCFRDDEVDKFHRKNFMKVELISIGNEVDEYCYNFMIKNCEKFFYSLSKHADIKVETTNVNSYGFYDYDILNNNIEVGSYGIRKGNNYSWIYGTGLAEPRFSITEGL